MQDRAADGLREVDAIMIAWAFEATVVREGTVDGVIGFGLIDLHSRARG